MGRGFGLSVLVVAALLAVTGFLGVRQPEPLPVSQTPVQFDAARALALTRELATRFPNRDDFHPDRARTAAWIRDQFTAMGLTPVTQRFSEVIASRQVEGLENVYAILPGRSDDIVVILGHYDIPPFVEQGAADDASGVGVVLELARIFSRERPGRTLLFMATDSEEYGAMWGTVNFLRQFAQRDRVVAVLTLDYLNMGEQRAITVLKNGFQRGYTPPWLRALALQSVRPETGATETGTLLEWIERSVVIPPTEHGIFLAAGIPAVDLSGVSTDEAWQAVLYHTSGDRIGNLTEGSMASYGRAAERLVRSVAELDRLPDQSGWYLGLPGGSYLPGWAVALMQLWLFLPLLLAVATGWRKQRRQAVAGGLNSRELLVRLGKRLFALWLPFGVGLAVLKVLPEIGWMVRYEIYPATQKDPILYHPQWAPILLVLAVIGLTLWLVGHYTTWLHRRETTWEETYLGVLTGLLGLTLLIWAAGAGFAAVSFLTLPAYLWLAFGPSRRWANTLLWLLSTTVFVAFLLLFRLLFKIGVIWWYLLMGAAYGLFSVQSLLGFLGALVLYIEALSLAWAGRKAG